MQNLTELIKRINYLTSMEGKAFQDRNMDNWNENYNIIMRCTKEKSILYKTYNRISDEQINTTD